MSPNHFQLKNQRKRIPSWAQMRIIAVQYDSHTETLIDWSAVVTIDIYESPIDNITSSSMNPLV